MIQQVSTVHQRQTELNQLRLAHNEASFQSMLRSALRRDHLKVYDCHAMHRNVHSSVAFR